MFDQVREFLKENPRAWMIFAAAAFTLLVVVWGVYGGFSFGFSRFFAAEPDQEIPTPSDEPVSTPTPLPASTPTPAGGSFDGRKPTPTELRDWAASQGWSEDFARFGDGVLQDWIDCCWNISAKKFNSRRAGVDGLWEKPTECPSGQVPSGPNETDPCFTLQTSTATPEPTSVGCPAPPATSAPATLTVTCGTTQNVLGWQNPLTLQASVNTVLKNTDGATGATVFSEGGCWNSFGIGTYTDTAVQPGHVYSYRIKTSATAVSNTVTCSGTTTTVTPVPTPVPTPTATFQPTPPPPSPQAGTLGCQPSTQTIMFGEFSDHFAQGGDGQSYTWTAFPGAFQESGSSYFATYSWMRIGTKRVTVTSGGETSECVVFVKGANEFSVTKGVRNETVGDVAFREAADVRAGQAIEFEITLEVAENEEAGPFRIVDSFPAGLSYIAGSARANGNAIPNPVLTASGLTFSDVVVPAGTTVVVHYAAFADRLHTLTVGPKTAAYSAAVMDTTFGQTDTAAAVTLTLWGTGVAGVPTPGGPSQIPTGPGDAITFAFIAAIASSLLYAAYTRSAAFRGREVRRIGRDQGPMDFRS